MNEKWVSSSSGDAHVKCESTHLSNINGTMNKCIVIFLVILYYIVMLLHFINVIIEFLFYFTGDYFSFDNFYFKVFYKTMLFFIVKTIHKFSKCA